MTMTHEHHKMFRPRQTRLVATMSEGHHPIVAIGVPCYNRPDLLDKALTSLRAQTYPAISILISDNASPNPDVGKVASRHAAEDSRVRYVRQTTNIGASRNFEYVLTNTDSPYFMWASDDDWWEPDFVARCVDRLEEEGEGVVSVVTEALHETPQASFTFFDQGEAFRQFRSRSALERMRNFALNRFGNLVYAVHRRDALFHQGRTIWAWTGRVANEYPPLLIVASKGDILTLPGVGFHKGTPKHLCELLRWHVQGGWFPRRKFYYTVTRAHKHVWAHIASYWDMKRAISSLDLDNDSKNEILSIVRKTLFVDARDMVIGWRRPIAGAQSTRSA